jgi:hypothetical protein
MPKHPKTINLTGFKGLNNVNTPDNTDQSYLKTALNIDIDKSGNINKRKGYTKVDATPYKSLWYSEQTGECYGVRGNSLGILNDDYSWKDLDPSFGPELLSFEEIENMIYYSSPNKNGIVEDGVVRTWGIRKVNLAPQLSRVQGTLPAGTYQVSYTYVSQSGRESGTSVSSVITVPDNSGISLSIPNIYGSEISFARVYCSTQNGEVLYFSGICFLGGSYTISNLKGLISPLRTFNLDAAPLGHIVKYYRGRVYIASGNILYYSEPFQYEFFRLDSNYIEFPSRIVEVMPVEDGIWIGSDKLYYLSGEEPSKFKRSTKEHVRVVEGTSSKISGSYVRIDNTPIGYKWLVCTDLGIFILFNQGMVLNTTSQNVSLERADSGTALFLQTNGMNQYLSILKTNQQPNNAVLGDLVETTIIRNGNIIT